MIFVHVPPRQAVNILGNLPHSAVDYFFCGGGGHQGPAYEQKYKQDLHFRLLKFPSITCILFQIRYFYYFSCILAKVNRNSGLWKTSCRRLSGTPEMESYRIVCTIQMDPYGTINPLQEGQYGTIHAFQEEQYTIIVWQNAWRK